MSLFPIFNVPDLSPSAGNSTDQTPAGAFGKSFDPNTGVESLTLTPGGQAATSSDVGTSFFGALQNFLSGKTAGDLFTRGLLQVIGAILIVFGLFMLAIRSNESVGNSEVAHAARKAASALS